jgi:hypothetical protein
MSAVQKMNVFTVLSWNVKYVSQNKFARRILILEWFQLLQCINKSVSIALNEEMAVTNSLPNNRNDLYTWQPTNASITIQFISHVLWLLHVSALYYHPHGSFLEPSKRCAQLTINWIVIDSLVGFHVYINEMHGSRSKKKKKMIIRFTEL